MKTEDFSAKTTNPTNWAANIFRLCRDCSGDIGPRRHARRTPGMFNQDACGRSQKFPESAT
jgi:hypothetical protein